MTEWNTEVPRAPESWKAEVSALPVGGVMKLHMPKIMKVMEMYPKQFVWSYPGLLKRIAEDDGHHLLGVIYRHPKGITLGVLINRFRHLSPEAVTKSAAKLEAGGLVRSVSSVHKYNKRQTVTYYPA